MLTLYGQGFSSRLLLGTAQYPSPESLKQAVKASGEGYCAVPRSSREEKPWP